MKRSFSLLLFFALLALGSCRKNNSDNPSISDKEKDDILEKTRDIYLWNDQIPDNFNPRNYNGPEQIMNAVRLYSMEPGFAEPVDHYSFAIKKTEWDNISTGVSSDFGLSVFFYGSNDLRVSKVEAASPAGLAGIRRGWKILKINGSTNISSSNSEFIINNIYYSSGGTITFQKPDGSTSDLTLAAATYQENPIYLDTLYTAGSRKAGYLVFNSFLGNVGEVINRFAEVFTRFATAGVTDLIIDLRYNGGGYVNLQEKLANYLIKSSAGGSVMMHTMYSANHPENNETVVFEKLGGVNLNNIYFIVSDNTASASELLINNLKPYMNVKLFGEATYGKPVGFYGVEVGDWLVFPVSFRSTNGLGEGDYFDGIEVDKTVADGLDKDWGDRSELRLASVLHYVETGSFDYVSIPPGLNSTLDSEIKTVNKKLSPKSFRGTIGK